MRNFSKLETNTFIEQETSLRFRKCIHLAAKMIYFVDTKVTQTRIVVLESSFRNTKKENN